MTTTRKERGFTLLELVISAAIVSILAAIGYSLVVTGASTYSLGSTQTQLEAKANRVVDAITEALAESGQSVITPVLEPPLGSAQVTLQRNAGYSKGAIQWGAVLSFELKYTKDDPNDGVDNDGDGLIDECVIVFTENAGEADEESRVLVTSVSEYLEGEVPNGKDDNGNGLVDERGLAISSENGIWTVRLSLERQDSEGRSCTRTVVTAVRPRN